MYTFYLFVLVFVSFCEATVYDSSFAFVQVSNGEVSPRSFCVNFQQWHNETLPNTADQAISQRLEWWGNESGNLNVCLSESRQFTQPSTIALDYRLENSSGECAYPFNLGNASFKGAIKYQTSLIQNHSVSTGIFVVKKGYQFFANWHDYLSSDFVDPDLTNAKIPIFFIYLETFRLILQEFESVNSTDIMLKFFRPPPVSLDVALLIIWLIAVFCVSVGGYWAGTLKRSEENFITEIEDNRPTESNAPSEETKTDGWVCNCAALFVIMVIVCGILMLGFYFRSVMIVIFNLLLVIIGTFSIYRCMSTACSVIACGQCKMCMSISDMSQSLLRRDLLKWNWCQKRPMWRSIVFFLMAGAICISWFFVRRKPLAFILLDLINICICLHFLKGVRFPNLKWLSALMACMFFYDLFMVFITPLITTDGCSIMVQVASGTACSSTNDRGDRYPIAPIDSNIPEKVPIVYLLDIPEKFPLLFQVPRLNDPMRQCFDVQVEREYRMVILGLGYLIAFCFCVDFVQRQRLIRGYGLVSVIGYAFGLVITFLALILMRTAQPALIYLVPFTFLPVAGLALMRRQFLSLWHGTWQIEKRDDPIEQETTSNSMQ